MDLWAAERRIKDAKGSAFLGQENNTYLLPLPCVVTDSSTSPVGQADGWLNTKYVKDCRRCYLHCL